MRKLLSSLLALLVLAGTASFSQAADGKTPLVVVSFGGYDKLVADISLIGKLAGNDELGKQVEMMALMLPQGEGSKGPLSLDTKQPWGAVLTTDGKGLKYYGFVPVTDIKPSIELAKAQLGQEIKEEKGVYEFEVSGQKVYATQKGKWGYIAASKEQLADVSAEPAALLGDLPKNYTLAARISTKDLPKEYRDQFIAQLRAGAEVGMNQLPNAGDDAKVKETAAKNSIEQLSTIVNDMDSLVIGWNVDSKTKTTYLDVEIKAQAGTKLAEQFATVKPGKTNFAGMLLPDAAITMSSVGTMSDAEVVQAKASLKELRQSAVEGLENQGLTGDEVKVASKLLGEALEVLEKTIDTKKSDLAMSVLVDSKRLTFVGGCAIAEGNKLDGALKQLIAEVKKNDEAAGSVKFGDETVDGIHVYSVTMPTPDEQVRPFFGDKIELAVGVANDKVVAAGGRDAIKTLKSAIANLKKTGPKEVPPFQLTLAAASLAKFTGEVADDPQTKSTAVMLGSLLEKAGKQGHITLTAQPVEQGMRMRLELEEGLLKAIGSLSQMMGGMAPSH